MSVSSIAMKAYANALDQHKKAEAAMSAQMGPQESDNGGSSFVDSITNSLQRVNDMQMEKNNMVEAFASGEEHNVHELMISLQKAGLAVNMTSAVRNKIMTAYQEIMRMPF